MKMEFCDLMITCQIHYGLMVRILLRVQEILGGHFFLFFCYYLDHQHFFTVGGAWVWLFPAFQCCTLFQRACVTLKVGNRA